MNNIIAVVAFAMLLIATAFFTLNPFTFILLLLTLGLVLLLLDSKLANVVLVAPQAKLNTEGETAQVVSNARDVGFEAAPVDARPTQDDNSALLANNTQKISNDALDEQLALSSTALSIPRVETPIGMEEISEYNNRLARRGQDVSEKHAMNLRDKHRTKAADPRQILNVGTLHARTHGQILFLQEDRDAYDKLAEVRLQSRVGAVGRHTFAHG